MSGCKRARIASGVSSSKMTTASTQSSDASTAARSSSGTRGRPGPLRRRTDASSLRQTIRQSPSARACLRKRTCPAWSKSKHPPVATTVPPCARVRAMIDCAGAVLLSVRNGVTGRLPSCTEAAPPSATNADAAITASLTASAGSAPSASISAAAEAKRSPAPHESVACAAGAGTAIGGPSPLTSTAPRLPSVIATPSADHLRTSRRPRLATASRLSPATPGA